jgi:hypothetical protein
LVEASQVFSEVCLFVASDQANGEEVIASSEGGQLGQGLLTRTTETYKKATTFREPYDSMNLCNML